MNELPPIHLINLDRSTERLRLFRERNRHLEDVIRVPATDGSELDREALISSGYINRDLGSDYTAGTLGCAVSHLKLWEMAVTQNRSITIFEDDIFVSYQFKKRALEVLSVLPVDWDIIQWGFRLNPSFAWVDLGVCKVELQGYGQMKYQGAEGRQRFQAEDFSPAPLRLLHSFGTHGYSISAKGARAALEYCLPLGKGLITFPDAGVITEDEGIDVALCGLYPSLKAFVCMPQLLMFCDEQESVRTAIDKE